MGYKDKSIRLGDISMDYRVEEPQNTAPYVVITSSSRLMGVLNIPETIEELPVKGIEKKAFLGQQNLRQVTIPETVEEIKEWAFSGCKNLERIEIENPKISFQKGAFLGCENLKAIHLKNASEDAALLLAILACGLEGEYLLTDPAKGSREWFSKWDHRLESFLKEDDEEGYMKLALCGEEDIMLNMSEFMAEKRRQKSKLCLMRLKADEALNEEYRKVFTDYIVGHTKGCEDEQAWESLFYDFDGDVEYYELFAHLGAVNEKNLDDILLFMGSEHAQAKAFLLKYKEKHFGKQDVFAAFSL